MPVPVEPVPVEPEAAGQCEASELVKVNAQLRREIEELSSNMGEVFEQQSLLYSMMENLRGSNSATELFAVVQDWLADILPAEQVIMEIHGNDESARNGCTTYLSFGEDLLDRTSFKRFIEYLELSDSEVPLVLNEEKTDRDGWPFADIRELIVVPLRTDDRNTGWMAALNHAGGGWFGTTQARLLHAVATLLGMRVLFEEVVDLRETSETASAAKSLFLTNVSHEFRTPLNGIMSFTRGLLDDSRQQECEFRESLQTIDSCAQRLFEMVEDVVEFSKFDAGRRGDQCIPCRLDEFVESVVAGLRARAQSKRLRIHAILLDCSAEIISIDPVRLKQVLSILVRNAIKFTDVGAITVTAKVVDGDARRLLISVQDTGVGVAPDKLESIFDPFVIGDESLTRRHGGLGLGLAISRRILRGLGGDLTVNSQPGRGSTFTLDVQMGTPVDFDDRDDESLPRVPFVPSSEPTNTACASEAPA